MSESRKPTEFRKRRVIRVGLTACATALASVGVGVTSAHADDSGSDCSTVVGQHYESPLAPGVAVLSGAIDGLARVVNTDLDGSIAEWRIPPLSWTALTASPEELAYYHVPQRPTDPEGLASWLAEWSTTTGASFVVSPMCTTNQTAGPASVSILDILLSGGQGYTNKNWAGVVADSAINYTEAYGGIKEPTASFCSGTPVSDHVSWAGLGGVNGASLLQNGVQQEGTTLGSDAIWYEGLNSSYDSGEITFPGLLVHAGDGLTFTTTYSASPSATGTVTFGWHDVNQNFVATPSMTTISASPVNNPMATPTPQKVNTMYSGTTAEGIDERSTDRFATPKRYLELRNFTPVAWTQTRVARGGSTTLSNIRSVSHHGWEMHQGGHATGTLLASVADGSDTASFTTTHQNCGSYEPSP